MTTLIFVSLLPLMAMIILGYVLKKKLFVDDGFWQGAEKINYYIFFPIMLFLSLATAKISRHELDQVVFVAISILTVVYVALFVLKKQKHIISQRFGVYVQGLLRFNTYIGLALVASLFKQQGMAIFAILLVVCIPIVNVFSVVALTDSSKMNVKDICIAILKNPLILGCIAGGLFNYSSLPLWMGAENLLKQFAVCSLPLGLMCVGAALQFKGLLREIGPLFWTVMGRMLLMPVLAFSVCKWLKLGSTEMYVLVIFFALPTASASYILTKVLGGDSRLMASVISLQTVVAGITLPVILYFMI